MSGLWPRIPCKDSNNLNLEACTADIPWLARPCTNHSLNSAFFLFHMCAARGRERALASFAAAAQRAAASPLLEAAGVAVPLVPEQPSPTEIPGLSSQLQAAAAAAAKWVAEQGEQLQAQQQQAGGDAAKGSAKKALKAAQKAQEEREAQLQGLQAAVAEAAEAGTAACAPFVWVDGPLVTAMRRGDMILIDEINLADDAVLERLNRQVMRCWHGGWSSCNFAIAALLSPSWFPSGPTIDIRVFSRPFPLTANTIVFAVCWSPAAP